MANDYKIWDRYCLSTDSPEVRDGAGRNRIPEPERKSLLSLYLEKYKDPLIIILCVILLLSCGVTAYEIVQTGQMRLLFEPMGIFLAILLATGIAFIFEVKANREFDIRKKVRDEDPVKVVRRTGKNRPRILSIRKCDVVAGDLVKLEGGDEVPADGRIVAGDTVRIDESAYTGEPYTHKSPHGGNDARGDEAYEKDFLLRGSIVLEGSCYYKVTAVGADTEEGKGEKQIREEAEVETPLNRQLGQLSEILTRASYIIAGLIVVGRIIYYFLGIDSDLHSPLFFVEYLLHSVMIAVTLIVVAVPEGLPMSVTVSLALSMRRMLKENNLVRRLHACETMGAATFICTDKTGTLTQNRMTVVRSHFTSDNEGEIAETVSVNSTAELTEKEDGTVAGIGNPTEVALLRWITDAFDADYAQIRSDWEILSSEPFSTQTKYMSTTARNLADGRVVKFLKGAPEIILDRCGPDFPGRAKVEEELLDYQSKAMRTLGFAELSEGADVPVMKGIVGIADPVREDVKDAIATCRKAGVRVIMVTGDVAPTAMEIGRQLGLVDEGSCLCLTGTEFAAMPDEEALKMVRDLRILSRARPEDKARLVSLLQRLGEVVAVTGDGTNDALALRKAQVGLSMGDGTARAKEVSDITILDNSFASINKAILWGRSLYMNIRRFLVFQMVINVCACLVVLVGAVTGIDSPLNVTQMLWVNLIMDTFAAMALSSLPPDERVMSEQPRSPGSHIVSRKMLGFILSAGLTFFVLLAGFWQLLWHKDITSFSDVLTLDAMREFFSGFLNFHHGKTHMSPYEAGVFFSTFVMMQFWNLFNVRYFMTDRFLLSDLALSLFGKRKLSDCFSRGFLLIAAVILLGQFLIVNFAGNFFEVAPLAVSDWLWILLATSPVLLLPDLVRAVVMAVRKALQAHSQRI